jgi:hypothetical protein
VRYLLRSGETRFLLVAGPGPDRVPDAMFFRRRLEETGHRLGPLFVNSVHPDPGPDPAFALLRHLADRDRRGLELLRSLLPGERAIVAVPLVPKPPGDLEGLEALYGTLRAAAPAQAPD